MRLGFLPPADFIFKSYARTLEDGGRPYFVHPKYCYQAGGNDQWSKLAMMSFFIWNKES